MLKPVPGLLAAALFIGASSSTMYAAGGSSVFVMKNNAVGNEILTYQPGDDGQFVLRERVATGVRGSGGLNDPLQSQGSLTLSGDHSLLFAANSASGTVSSFHIVNGVPVLVDQKPSGGAFPVSVAEHNHTVYVLNASGSGAVVGFTVDQFGHLFEIPNSTTHLTQSNSGAPDISVSPNGQWLVVIEKVPNHIDVFPIRPDGTLGTVVADTSVTPGRIRNRVHTEWSTGRLGTSTPRRNRYVDHLLIQHQRKRHTHCNHSKHSIAGEWKLLERYYSEWPMDVC